jgi:SNF2 family DNA or RNA helicase
MSQQLPLVSPCEIVPIEPDEGPTLYPYQEKGRDYLRANKCALLADDMGVGKTVQVAAALTGEPALIICPPTAVGVWLREIRTWAPDYEVSMLPKLNRFPRPREALVLPRSRMPTHPRILQKRKAKKEPETEWRPYHAQAEPEGPMMWEGMHPNTTVVIDEVHEYKNAKAERSVNLQTILDSGCERRWGLTGTPLLSYATDLF